MCYRGGQARAGGREFAGFESVEGGVRGIFVRFRPLSLRYTSGVRDRGITSS